MVDYKDELDDILVCDPQLAKEIDYDIREYNKTLQKNQQQHQKGAGLAYPFLTPGKTPGKNPVCPPPPLLLPSTSLSLTYNPPSRGLPLPLSPYRFLPPPCPCPL
jgi:hypothetical protein